MKRLLALLLLCALLPLSIQAQFAKLDSAQRFKFAAIPMITYNPSFGLVYGAMATGFYRLSRSDTISPLSSTSVFMMGTTNKSYFGTVFQSLYFREDTYRSTIALGGANINFQYYQSIPILGGIFIDYNSLASFAYFEFQRKTIENLYIGVSYALIKSNTEFYLPDSIPNLEKENNLHNLGFLLSYDSRDNVNNPGSGWFTNFKVSFYRDWLGSSKDYQFYEFNVNKFQKLGSKGVIVPRFKLSVATGDVPFEGETIVGRDDIRGYTNGKYRGRQVYALQTEYRWNFYKKFGMVAFAGIATAVDNPGEMTFDGILPGAGLGIRYMMIESGKINVGLDIAVGKEDWGIYFRIGEAFSR